MNVGISSCTDEPCRACGGTRTEKGDDKTQAGLATSPLGFADAPSRSAFLPYCRLMRRGSATLDQETWGGLKSDRLQ